MLLLEDDEGPRGPELACGSDSGLIHLWELTPDRTVPPRLRAQMHGHTAAVHALQHLASGEGRGGEGRGLLVSCSADGTVRLWSIATLRCEVVLLGHTAAVLCATPTPAPLPPLPALTLASEPPPVLLVTA